MARWISTVALLAAVLAAAAAAAARGTVVLTAPRDDPPPPPEAPTEAPAEAPILVPEECSTCDSVTLAVPSLGSVRGYVTTTRALQKQVASFLGMRYARTPARFERSEIIDSWEEEVNGRVRAPMCPQGKFYPEDLEGLFDNNQQQQRMEDLSASADVGEDEDCLTLDVYVPKAALDSAAGGAAPALPVLFFVHGGAFVRGSSRSARPHFLMDHGDMVIVAPQYRLGPLGFLVAGGATGTGNQGLWDQKVALEWTRTHVAAFGGNPQHIIIGGVSAGGATSGLLYASPHTAALVKGALLFSGTAVSPWTIDAQPRASTKSFAALCGCGQQADALRDAEAADGRCAPSDGECALRDQQLRDCLDETPLDELQNATFVYAVTEKMAARLGMGCTIPVVDGPDGMLPEEPVSLITKSSFTGKPMIVGVTRDEGQYIFVQVDMFYMHLNNLKNDKTLAKHGMGDLLVHFAGVEDHLHVLGHAVNEAFWSERQRDDYSTMDDGIIDFTGAGYFKGPARAMALLNAQRSGSSWLYTFDYMTVSERAVAAPQKPRANHGSDQMFLFPSRNEDFTYASEDYENVDKFCKMVANFVLHLDPRGAGAGNDTHINGARWPPINDPQGEYLRIEKQWETRSNWNQEYHATSAFNTGTAPGIPSGAVTLLALAAAVVATRR